MTIFVLEHNDTLLLSLDYEFVELLQTQLFRRTTETDGMRNIPLN